jgi:hypothetical protein
MTEMKTPGSESDWICNMCKVPLTVQKIRLQYFRTIFAFSLPACPQCGMVLIDERLATGKMAEAEQALEDK